MKWNNLFKVSLGILVSVLMIISSAYVFAQDKGGDPQMQSGRAPQGMIGDQPGRGGGFMGMFDKDKDGKVTKKEFPGPDNIFDQFDKNGDGAIDESEAPKGPPPGGQGGPQMQSGRTPQGMIGDQPGQGGGFMGRFDKDKDGKVSKEEFTGPDNIFDQFDKNKDGFIDKSEEPKGPPPRQ